MSRSLTTLINIEITGTHTNSRTWLARPRGRILIRSLFRTAKGLRRRSLARRTRSFGQLCPALPPRAIAIQGRFSKSSPALPSSIRRGCQFPRRCARPTPDAPVMNVTNIAGSDDGPLRQPRDVPEFGVHKETADRECLRFSFPYSGFDAEDVPGAKFSSCGGTPYLILVISHNRKPVPLTPRTEPPQSNPSSRALATQPRRASTSSSWSSVLVRSRRIRCGRRAGFIVLALKLPFGRLTT
jgi:hypothetical protein